MGGFQGQGQVLEYVRSVNRARFLGRSCDRNLNGRRYVWPHQFEPRQAFKAPSRCEGVAPMPHSAVFHSSSDHGPYDSEVVLVVVLGDRGDLPHLVLVCAHSDPERDRLRPFFRAPRSVRAERRDREFRVFVPNHVFARPSDDWRSQLGRVCQDVGACRVGRDCHHRIVHFLHSFLGGQHRDWRFRGCRDRDIQGGQDFGDAEADEGTCKDGASAFGIVDPDRQRSER
mmetsp:Transcript_60927/g.185976  ORF Transcript_60927/g.185976 Transcript_60927/m.185976 type:complete len:228 (-) Transcript_60927:353-1036(-)